MHNMLVMVQFMRRDITIYGKRLATNFINDVFIRPVFAALIFGYVFPHINVQNINPGVLYIGSLLYILTPLAYGLNIDYLLDIEREKSIEYKLTILPAFYVLTGRALLTALLMSIGLIVSLPVAYLLVGGIFDFSHAQWLPFLGVTWCSALAVTSMTLCFMSGMKGAYQSRWFWRRTVFPLVMFGGFYAPWATMAKASTLLGYGVLVNPYLYITEGLRSTLFGGTFIPWYYCCVVLVLYAVSFLALGCYLLKKNIDYV